MLEFECVASETAFWPQPYFLALMIIIDTGVDNGIRLRRWAGVGGEVVDATRVRRRKGKWRLELMRVALGEPH